MKNISVVIIGKNVEEYLDACINSIIKTSKNIKKEIIYVDSRSVDKSVDIARKKNIRILKIKKGNVMTPSAGRYIGYAYATREIILFIDGDMILNSKWLKEGINIMEKNNKISIVTGTGKEKRGSEYVNIMSESIGFVDSAYGAYLVRKKDISDYNLINPYLNGGEEEYMSWIINYNNKLVYRTKTKIITHLGYKEGYDSRLKRAGYEKGNVQRIKLLPKGLKFKAIKKITKKISISIYSLTSIGALFLIPVLLRNNITLGYIAIVYILLFPLIIILKKSNIKEAFLSYIFFYYETFNFIKTLLEPIPDIKSYSTNVEIIK